MEKLHEPLASRKKFFSRLAQSFLIGALLIVLAVFIGMVGYHYFEDEQWVDAFLSASMILSGMGPVSALKTTAGKLFAGFYALFSGLVFLAIFGIVFAPIVHRFYHDLHIGKTPK